MKKQQAYQGVTIVVSIYDQAIRLLPPSHDHRLYSRPPRVERGKRGNFPRVPGFRRAKY
jgi:hypothetical protein